MKKADLIKKIKEELTLENVLMKAIKTPGVKIKRDSFLRKELIKYYHEDIIKEVIKNNPAKAGIPKRVINKIAESVINYETRKVSGLSFLASLPSSVNMLAAFGSVSADITSFFVHVIRIVQELAYLYGFQEFDFTEDNIDSETMDLIMTFMGVMFKVQGAESLLNKLADNASKQVSKKLARKALTKGTVYPFVKTIAKKVGMRMTKQIFADAVATIIPIAGSLASSGLTWVSFKPNCKKLQKTLMSYNLCDPDFYRVVDEAEKEK